MGQIKTRPNNRLVVKDNEVCKTCLYGQIGCPASNYIGKEVVACIGYKPAAERI